MSCATSTNAIANAGFACSVKHLKTIVGWDLQSHPYKLQGFVIRLNIKNHRYIMDYKSQ
jgi:hypothetical protein